MVATNRFNSYLNSHFSGCLLLHRMPDHNRGREISFYQIPGEWDLVGLSDGTDAFMVPTSTADATSLRLKKILDEVRNGKLPEVGPTLKRRPLAGQVAAPTADAAPGLQRRAFSAALAAAPAPVGAIPRRPIRS